MVHSARLALRTFAAALLGWAASGQASEGGERKVAAIMVGEPAGFGALTGPQKTVADVYFGGRRVGEAAVTYQPGSIRFDNIDALIRLLPEISDAAAVQTALSGRALPSNTGLICTPGADRNRCGRMTPEVAGVIFDEGRFRVDLFINPSFLMTRSAAMAAYMDRPQAGVSVVNAFSGVFSGSSRNGQSASFQNRLIVGIGEGRIRAEVAYADGRGFQSERMVAEIDRPGWRYSAGTFWTAGSDLSGRRKVLGIAAETQFDTRLDKDTMRGNRLVVFLNARSRVDIIRDGRLLTSGIYEAGNQELDTSNLPDGSYEIVVKIEENGGATREERRFFSRNRQIAPIGKNIWYGYAGVLVNDSRPGFLRPTRTPFAQAGVAHRAGAYVGVDATVLATDRAVVAEAGATWLGKQAQVRISAVAGSNRTIGGALRVGSSGNGRLNFDFDLRHIRMRRSPSDPDPPDEDPIDPAIRFDRDLAGLRIARETFSQATANVGYSFPGAQIGLAAAWRRERGAADRYNVGPWARWEVLQRGQLHLSFDASWAKTNEGQSGFAGLSLRLQGKRTTLGASAGYRTQSPDNDSSGPVLSLSGTWADQDLAGANVEVSAGYARDQGRDTLNAGTRVQTRSAELTGGVTQSLGSNSSMQYSLGFQSALAMRGGKVALVGRNPNESMLMVRIEGAPASSRFSVLVDDFAIGEVRGDSTLSVAIVPYRQYNVSIRPLGRELLHYDTAPRKIGVYPGNVARLAWKAQQVVAMFGQLVFADGKPAANAVIRTEGSFGQSDDSGWFQIEAATGSAFDVTLPDRRTCRIDPPKVQQTGGYAALGTVLCNPTFHGSPFNTARLP